MSEASKLYKTPGKNSPKMPLKRAILVAPNGWISVCLGLIWAGYIQDGLVPFGPTEIAPGEPWGVRSPGLPTIIQNTTIIKMTTIIQKTTIIKKV